MLNKDTTSLATESNPGVEEDWDEELYKKEKPQKPDLHNVDTHSTYDLTIHQRKKKHLPPRTRKSSSPHDNFSGVPVVHKKEFYSPTPPSTKEIFLHYPHKNEVDYGSLESTRSLENEEFESPLTQNKEDFSKTDLNQTVVIPERDDTIVEDLSNTLKSTLTFGDTQDLFEKIQDNNIYPLQTVSKNYEYQSQNYLPNDPNVCVNRSASKSPSLTDVNTFTDSTETDIMLHNFIRHDPPSITPDPDSVQSSTDMFSLSDSQQYLCNEVTDFDKQHPLLNGKSKSVSTSSNGQGSNSSLASDSPLQNVSPYGSFENHIMHNPTGSLPVHQNAQLPLSYSMNLQGNEDSINNLQDSHLNRSLAPQMTYGSLPTGYLTTNHPIQGMIPLNPQLPGIPQYRLPNSNMMLPPLHAQDLRNPAAQMYQAQLQNFVMMNAAFMQYQQAQFAALNAAEGQKDQTNTGQPQITQHQSDMAHLKNQPQIVSGQNHPQISTLQSQPPLLPPQNQPYMIPSQNQPHMISRQNQPQMVPLQNQKPMIVTQNRQIIQSQSHSPDNLIHLPNQSHMLSAQEPSLPKHDVFPKEYQQQHPNMQNHANPIIPQSDKTDLQQQYIETVQRLQQLQQAMGNSQIQPQPIQFPPPQPFMYPPHPLAVSMNNFYPGMPVIPPVTQHQQPNQVPNVDQISPTTQEDYSNVPGSMNVAQAPMEPTGHHRLGRLH